MTNNNKTPRQVYQSPLYDHESSITLKYVYKLIRDLSGHRKVKYEFLKLNNDIIHKEE